MTILHLRNIYQGKEIYVFGSGASLEYIPPSYFNDKICIATNRVGFEYGLDDYWVAGHHYEGGEYYRQLGCAAPMVLPDKDINNLNMAPIADRDNVFRFPASKQYYENFSVNLHFPEEDDRLVVGSSGFHTSLHLAQYMGASTIIIVALDQGKLDGKTNFQKYTETPHLPDKNTGVTDHSFVVWEQHTRQMVAKIRSLGCNVFSLNPFMNWNLEGHHYSGVNVADRDVRVAVSEPAVADRDVRVAVLEQAVADRDVRVAVLEQAVADRDVRVGVLEHAVADRDVRVGVLEQAVADRDVRVGVLEQAVADRDVRVGVLEQAVAECNTILHKIHTSLSWKITWPIRAFFPIVKRLCQKLVKFPKKTSDLYR